MVGEEVNNIPSNEPHICDPLLRVSTLCADYTLSNNNILNPANPYATT